MSGVLFNTFTTIFVIIDPIVSVLTFISLTSNMSHEDKNEIAEKAVTLACFIALFFRNLRKLHAKPVQH